MNYNDIAFCIPSYKRADEQGTLVYLRGAGVPAGSIYVFVQTEDDLNKYARKYDRECKLIYAHAETLPQTRNNILERLAADKNIVMMDDDISMISAGSKGRAFKDITDADELFQLFAAAYEKAAALRCSMFGFYPVYNAYFMSDTVDTLKSVNTILGFPQGFSYRFDRRFLAKEDLELCGRIIASGGRVARFNNIAFKAKHRTNAGGAYDIWKSGVNRKYAALLEGLYPDVYKVQASKQEEVRMVTRGGRKGIQAWKR